MAIQFNCEYHSEIIEHVFLHWKVLLMTNVRAINTERLALGCSKVLGRFLHHSLGLAS